MGKVYCIGMQCPVKNTCQRYTKGIDATMYDGTTDRYIRRCTNQKKYVQDKTRINESCLRNT